MRTKAQEILDAARQEAASVDAWADLSNFLFDPDKGVVSQAYPVGQERSAFMQSPEYKAIRQLISDLQERTGFIAGMTPKKSGKFAVLVPASLRPALEAEARREGVSLDQLVAAKLSSQMSHPLTPHG